MQRVFNFSAGPASIPEAVLQKAQQELLSWEQEGASVMEISHRSKAFNALTDGIEEKMRRLLNIPDNYHVLFLHGGATGQFSAIPMNLIGQTGKADYLITGHWGQKAYKEAQKYGDIAIAASNENDGFRSMPRQNEIHVREDASFLHVTPNETIAGIEFDGIVPTDVPIVADMSSTILSRPIDVSQFGLIYAGAQKNMGPAGITMVIVRKDLLGHPLPQTPMIFDYAKQAEQGSKLNTPATFSWYMLGLVVDWIIEQGGLDAMAKQNEAKAKLLYDAIDASDFYHNPIDPVNRSWMNVVFTLANSELDAAFLSMSHEAGLHALKGHRSVGGMRASIYNAMSMDGVKALVDFMQAFESEHNQL